MEEKEEILTNPLDNLDGDEKKTPDAEEQKDNSKPDNQEEEQEEEKSKTPKLSALEKRHAEQQEWSRKEVERLRNLVIEEATAKASTDAKSLLDLHEKDPKIAEEVAKKFWYASFKDAKKYITTELGVEDTSEKVSKDDFETMYQERRAKEEHAESVIEAKAMFDDLPKKEKEQALEEFEELSEGRTLTRAKAIKLAELVTLSVNKGKIKTETFNKALNSLSSTWVSNSKKSTEDLVEVIVDWKITLLDPNKLK